MNEMILNTIQEHNKREKKIEEERRKEERRIEERRKYGAAIP